MNDDDDFYLFGTPETGSGKMMMMIFTYCHW